MSEWEGEGVDGSMNVRKRMEIHGNLWCVVCVLEQDRASLSSLFIYIPLPVQSESTTCCSDAFVNINNYSLAINYQSSLFQLSALIENMISICDLILPIVHVAMRPEFNNKNENNINTINNNERKRQSRIPAKRWPATRLAGTSLLVLLIACGALVCLNLPRAEAGPTKKSQANSSSSSKKLVAESPMDLLKKDDKCRAVSESI